MSLALWIGVGAVLVQSAPTPPRVALARVEVSGPSRGVESRWPGAGSARIEFVEPLTDGERVTVTMAVPRAQPRVPDSVWRQALAQSLGAEGATFLDWAEQPVFAALDPELAARPLPEWLTRAPRAPWSALFVIGASLAIVLARRRQWWICAGVAVAASASVVLLVRGESAGAAARLRWVEARFDAPPSSPWLALESRRGRFDGLDPSQGRLELRPEVEAIACTTRIAGRDVQEPPRVDVVAPGAVWTFSRAFVPSSRRLSRDVNALGSFDVAWLRESDGRWTELGPWALGDELPAGGAGEPPGWLVPPLPMGVSVFIGRLSTAGGLGPLEPDPRDPEAAIWLRGLGL